MTESAELRWRFLAALWTELRVVWPILSGLVGAQLLLGMLVGYFEGWRMSDAAYFTFITGLTIGYGDMVPRQGFARGLAIAIGVSGVFLTGVIAGIAVYAMRKALDDCDTD